MVHRVRSGHLEPSAARPALRRGAVWLALVGLAACGGGNGTGPDGGGLDAGGSDAGLDGGAVDAGTPDAGGPIPRPSVDTFDTTSICTRSGWCWENPRPTGVDLSDVHVVGANDVWFSGEEGTVLHWDGTSYRLFQLADPFSHPHGLIVVDGQVWVTNGSGAHRLGPTAWQTTSLASLFNPDVIWGATASDLWVGAEQATLLRGSTSGFMDANLPVVSSGVTAIHGSSGSDVWVGTSGGSVHRWNGTGWDALGFVSASPRPSLVDLRAFSPTEAWAIGGDELYRFSTAVPWVREPAPVLIGGRLASFWGLAMDDAWFVGNAGWISHRVPGGWTNLPAVVTHDLASVRGATPTDVWAVGQRGTILHYDGTSWTDRRTVTSECDYVGAYAASADDVFAIARCNGRISRRVGGAWQTLAERGGFGSAVHGTSATDVWFAGSGGLEHYDGAAFATVTLPFASGVTDVWAAAPGDVWVCGGGSVAHFDGSTWQDRSPAPRVPAYSCTGIWGSASGEAWLVDTGGDVLHWVGSSWTVVPGAGTRRKNDVWGSAANDVWICGEAGANFHWDGTALVRYVNDAISCKGIWGSASNDIFLVEATAGVWHYDGRYWLDEITTQSLAGVTGAGGRTWVVGADGTILVTPPQ